MGDPNLEESKVEEVKMQESKKTALGLEENIEAVLCYLVGWITGIIFLLLEKENKFVRFHAIQSIAINVVIIVFSMIIGMIPIIGLIASIIIFPVSIILWLFLMYKAFQGERYKLPVIGDWAEQQVGS